MSKQEFLDQLRARLSGLPRQDVIERLNFYSEMIDDRVEEGRSEDEAVLDIGSVDEISAQIISEIPLAKIAKEKVKPKKRLSAAGVIFTVIFLVISSPIWLSLLCAFLGVAIALYVVLCAVIVAIVAVFLAFVACVIGGFIAGVMLALGGNPLSGLLLIGAAVLCAGLSIFAFFVTKAAIKGIILLTKKTVFGIKKIFVKERA